jgi:predicted nuclease with RNAse H fold
VRALGIDVGVRKGLDLVAVDEGRVPTDVLPGVRLEDVERAIRQLRPDVVAIDAPPAWSAGGASRLTERILLQVNIHSFNTPAARNGSGHRFYAWIESGFQVFEAAERAGFPRYAAGPARGTALEVFPHASATVLAGALAPRGMPKRAWREEVLRDQGVPLDQLRTADLVDAALCALTGLLALQGKRFAPGDPKEGVIVLPVVTLPARPYAPIDRRAAGTEDAEPALFRSCACGDPTCHALTRNEFAPGHDAKRKSMLWRLAREGAGAAAELRRRGWKIPPEIG